MSLDYCISRARELEYKHGQYRLYSVILDRKNRIVSEASNDYSKTHPMAFHYARRIGNPLKCFLHSEMSAIIKDKRRKGVKLVVARVNKKGEACMAMPCLACQLAINEHGGIQSVEYTI